MASQSTSSFGDFGPDVSFAIYDETPHPTVTLTGPTSPVVEYRERLVSTTTHSCAGDCDRLLACCAERPVDVDDRELLSRIRAGDQAAFAVVFRASYAPLVGMAESLLAGRAVAEEVVQDVMLELWRRRETLTLDESLRAYLFQSVRNRALNHLRHDRVKQVAEPELIRGSQQVQLPDELLEQEEVENAVRQSVSQLPPRCREVFELSRVHGLKYSEIAKVLGISVKTVETQMGKALRVLRERLAPWLPNGTGV
jgi:RNA polymerase sigma-70 factor (ECF subfamily)